MCYAHVMEYYSAIKRNEVLIHATAWANFENMMLSERNHKQNHTLYDSIVMCHTEKANLKKHKVTVARGWG